MEDAIGQPSATTSLACVGFTWLLVIWGLVGSHQAIAAYVNCDTCQCSVSESNMEKGVIHVRPQCMEGTIRWLHPYGAIRLRLSPNNPGGKFRVCFLIRTQFVSIKVSEETPNDVADLKTLFIIRSNKPIEHCLSSNYDPVILYIEPERSHEYTGPPKVEIQHEIVQLQNQFDPMGDCRPCSDDELLRAYCSSSFIVEGVMGKVKNNAETKTTIMEIHISRQVYAKSDIFYRRRRKGPLLGMVHVPVECEISRGSGIFLFMGRERFDRLHLTCAPYLSQWKTLLHQVQQTGTLECSYD